MPKADDIFPKSHTIQVVYRDVTLLEIDVNVEALEALCSENIVNSLFKGRIDIDEFLGNKPSIGGIKLLVNNPSIIAYQLGFNPAPEKIDEYIHSTVAYISNNLPNAVVQLLQRHSLECDRGAGVRCELCEPTP